MILRITRFMRRATLVTSTALLGSLAQAQGLPYNGSSFSEVINVIEDRDLPALGARERGELSVYQSHHLPQYEVSFFSLPLFALENDSKKTLVDKVDYYDRLAKMVHANGICVSGQWRATEQTPWTGYFKKDSEGLFIGRISVALQETTNRGDRGFGFAGKIFPTMNPHEKVATTNFFTVDVLSGTPAPRFLDVALTNDPPLTPNLKIAGVLSKIIPAFVLADAQPTFRPVTPIARMNLEGTLSSPRFMRLKPVPSTIRNDQADFRNEVLTAFHQNGQKLEFTIEGSSTTSDRNSKIGWQKIGTMMLDQVYLSYGCDRRLHFAHPKDDGTKVIPTQTHSERP